MTPAESIEDALVVGAGPIGLACAISAKQRNLDPLVIDAGAICNSVTNYPIQMRFFTTPELLEIGGHPFPCASEKPTREEALKYYRGVVRAEGLRVSTGTRLVGARRENRLIHAELRGSHAPERVRCHRLVLATGYHDHPNLLGIPGEDLPHVRHYFDEGHLSYDQDVVVIGGKNSAIEAALDLFRCGARVTLVYRRQAFRSSVKYWVKPDIENRIAAREIRAHLGAQVLRIDADSVTVQREDGAAEIVPADRVYALTGFHPDHSLFRRLGIVLEGDELRPQLHPETYETNVPGVFMAGSIIAGNKTSEIFIENGRFDGEIIFGQGSELREE